MFIFPEQEYWSEATKFTDYLDEETLNHIREEDNLKDSFNLFLSDIDGFMSGICISIRVTDSNTIKVYDRLNNTVIAVPNVHNVLLVGKTHVADFKYRDTSVDFKEYIKELEELNNSEVEVFAVLYDSKGEVHPCTTDDLLKIIY